MIISKLQNIDLLVCHYNQGGGLEPQIQQEHFSIISGYCLQLTRVLSVRGEGRMGLACRWSREEGGIVSVCGWCAGRYLVFYWSVPEDPAARSFPAGTRGEGERWRKKIQRKRGGISVDVDASREDLKRRGEKKSEKSESGRERESETERKKKGGKEWERKKEREKRRKGKRDKQRASEMCPPWSISPAATLITGGIQRAL